MAKSTIEWTDYTFSPWWGCVEVSPACDHCYARVFDKRVGGAHWGKDASRRELGAAHWKQPLIWDRAAARDGVRRRVFPSMCDPFEFRPPDERFGADLDRMRDDFFALIDSTLNLDWLLLTKRPQNVPRMLPKQWPMQGHARVANNVWIGATVESRDFLWRIDKLREIPAKVRFLSIEPLLGDIGKLDLAGIDWLIVGGESGHHARPMHPDWVRSIRDQCLAAGVPFFFKQHGEWAPMDHWNPALPPNAQIALRSDGSEVDDDTNPDDVGGHRLWRIGKKAAGRLLDGREWSQFPEASR